MNHFDASHDLLQKGFLDAGQWTFAHEEIRALVADRPDIGSAWVGFRHAFRTAFVRAVDAVPAR